MSVVHLFDEYLGREQSQVDRWAPVLGEMFQAPWRKSTAAENRAGVDVFLRRPNGTEAGVDLKFVATGTATVPVELVHTYSKGSGRLGWALLRNHVAAIAYVFERHEAIIVVPKPDLVDAALCENRATRNRRPSRGVHGVEWWTWNVWVRVRDLLLIDRVRYMDPEGVWK